MFGRACQPRSWRADRTSTTASVSCMARGHGARRQLRQHSAASANLKEGQSTTTIESKTNFFTAIPIGDVAKADTALHKGRTTMVWQTRITRNDGKLCALVTQTQLILERKNSVIRCGAVISAGNRLAVRPDATYPPRRVCSQGGSTLMNAHRLFRHAWLLLLLAPSAGLGRHVASTSPTAPATASM